MPRTSDTSLATLEGRLLTLRKAIAAADSEDERAQLIKEGGVLQAEVDFLAGCGSRVHTTKVA